MASERQPNRMSNMKYSPARSPIGLIAHLVLLTLSFAAHAQRDFGVDVSHFQGETGISQSSWDQMFTDGKRFAFVKATEGLTGPDDAAMANNIARATAAGLLVGVYHFAHPENRPTTNGAVQEADHLLTYAYSFIGPGFLRPVLDVEFNAATLSTAELTDWVIAFSDRIVALRGTNAAPIIYCNQSFANAEFDTRLAGYDLWLRTVGTVADPAVDDPPGVGFIDPTGVFNDWAFWQYDDFGSSGGITPLDLNVCHSESKSLNSFLIPVFEDPVAPIISEQPQSQLVSVGSGAAFSVSISITSSPPVSYQWRFNDADIDGATQSSYTVTNAQVSDQGPYTVVVTNAGGSITSEVALLTIFVPVTLYEADFDGYSSPETVTTPGTTNGFKILYSAEAGSLDFTAGFGFDYSTVTQPKSIPSAPRSTGGTTKGLSLAVNKDATAAAAAVNLYPVGQSFAGSFALKFDMWINWASGSGTTEHALFGINHSGDIANRIGLATSDGLFYAVDGDGGVSSTATVLRDYAVFQGGGVGAIPILKINGFGPAPLLGLQFDNTNPGFTGLFPAAAPAGSAGLGWVRAEVRQETNLITWLLNDVIVAQYTNTTSFTNGNIMIGYNDYFSSIGAAVNFVIFDNIRVETITPDYDLDGLLDQWELQYFGSLSPVPEADFDNDGASNQAEQSAGTNPTNAASVFRMLSGVRDGSNLVLSWTTVGGHSYVVQSLTNSNNGLSGNFLDLSPPIAVGGMAEGSTNWSHSGGATNPEGYYRVRIGP